MKIPLVLHTINNTQATTLISSADCDHFEHWMPFHNHITNFVSKLFVKCSLCTMYMYIQMSMTELERKGFIDRYIWIDAYVSRIDINTIEKIFILAQIMYMQHGEGILIVSLYSYPDVGKQIEK